MHKKIVISRTLSQYDNKIDCVVHKDSQVCLIWHDAYPIIILQINIKKENPTQGQKKPQTTYKQKPTIQVRTIN